MDLLIPPAAELSAEDREALMRVGGVSEVVNEGGSISACSDKILQKEVMCLSQIRGASGSWGG